MRIEAATKGNLPFKKMKNYHDRAEELRGRGRFTEAVEIWYSALELIAEKRPEFKEDLAALEKEGIATWKIIIYNGIAENYYALGAASPSQENRRAYYDWAVNTCENALNAAQDIHKIYQENKEETNYHVSIEKIISCCATAVQLAGTEISAQEYFQKGILFLDRWSKGLRHRSSCLSPEDIEKRKQLLLELEFGLALRDEEINPAKCIDALTAISRNMTLEHAEFPGDVLSALGILYHSEAQRSELPSQKISSLLKAKHCYELASEYYPKMIRTKKHLAKKISEEISNEIIKFGKPKDSTFRLDVKRKIDSIVQNAENNPLEAMGKLLNLKDFYSAPH